MESTSRGNDAATASAELRRLTDERAPILQQLSEGVIIAGIDGRLLFVNEAAERLHGVKTLDIAPDGYSDTYHLFTMDGAPYPPENLPLARAVIAGDTVEDARWRIRRPDGSEVVAIGSAKPLVEGGLQVGAILTIRDDSERFEAERALRASEEQLRLVLDTAPGAFYSVDRNGSTILVSRGFLEMMGFASEAEVIGRKLHGHIHHTHPDGMPYPVEHCPIYLCAATGAPAHVPDELFFRPDGSPVPVEYWVSPIISGDEHVGATCTILDLTDRKAAEQALRERSEEFYTLADNIPAMAWMAYADGSIFWYNRRWYDFTGTSPETQVGWGWEAVHDPEILPHVVTRWRASLESGQPFEMTFPLRRADGVFRPFLTRVVPIRDESGAILRWFGTNVDISEQVAAEKALIRLNETLERRVAETSADLDRAWRNASDIFVVIDGDGVFRRTNPATTAILGWTEDELVGRSAFDFVCPDDVAESLGALEHARSDVLPTFENRYRTKDGSLRTIAWVAAPEGELIYAYGRDVTAEREQQAELEQAQEALRQSQKMETIGQLTGGIAHDFNNLLQIITGNLDIVRRNLPADSTHLARTVDNAMKGADRAAILTQRLLAFSRRQPLAPKILDPNKLVSGMSEMLHRTLGENYPVETVLASGLWRVEADPNQLESALLNLAVNARDAMGDGGKLTIETANAHLDRSYTDVHSGLTPGQYVMLCVSDTGVGMDRETVDRAFEPFFTTKEVGKGTGLGLSMVYGFVKQSGGHLNIYSEPGEGTTIKIYLPRHFGDESASDVRSQTEIVPNGDPGATILICEDDEDVRALSAQSLHELGYAVVQAADGEAALQMLADGIKVDLLFTDVVLPGVSGAVLASRAKQLRPALKILFTTGYARNAIVHGGRLDRGVELLSKPFTYSDLAARIRDLLDAPVKPVDSDG